MSISWAVQVWSKYPGRLSSSLFAGFCVDITTGTLMAVEVKKRDFPGKVKEFLTPLGSAQILEAGRIPKSETLPNYCGLRSPDQLVDD